MERKERIERILERAVGNANNIAAERSYGGSRILAHSSRVVVFLATLLLALASHAAAPKVGEPLATLSIVEQGECVLAGDDTVFEPWNSDSLTGGLQVLEYVAARAGVDTIHQPFYDALADAGLELPVTKVVNSDDALWGTSGLVVGEIEKSKWQNPAIALVVDAEGLGQQLWQLEKKSAALFLLDAEGKVLFFADGKLDADALAEVLTLVKSSLPVD